MSKINIIAEPGKQEIVITREFDAPRDLVFHTYTNPELIPNWWGPKVLTTTVDEMEVRKGGRWRYVQRDPGGNMHAHSGVYHDITASERIVNTYEYEGFPGSVALVTTTFEDLPGNKTKLKEITLYPSVEVCEVVMNAGKAQGTTELMNRLEEVLAKLPA